MAIKKKDELQNKMNALFKDADTSAWGKTKAGSIINSVMNGGSTISTPKASSAGTPAQSYNQEVYQQVSLPTDVGEPPTYDSAYMDQLNALVRQLTSMNYDDWTKGNQYQSLSDRYGQSGKRSMQDVLGQVASRTGGLASSYATTAAQQQYNQYMAQLEEVARQMYSQERSDLMDNANLYRNLANDEYDRYRDSLSDYNARLTAAQAAARNAYSIGGTSGGSGTGGSGSSTQQRIEDLSYRHGTSGNLVSVPGYGEISYDDAETLEQQGYIKLKGVDKNGDPVYSKTGKKNYTNPIMMSR